MSVGRVSPRSSLCPSSGLQNRLVRKARKRAVPYAPSIELTFLLAGDPGSLLYPMKFAAVKQSRASAVIPADKCAMVKKEKGLRTAFDSY